jgi:uncharacterized YigZ family protein
MQTLAGRAEHTEIIKKSRFIARAAPVESVAAALAFVEVVSEAQATHNCWAYRLGAAHRFNDDGEPGGTAGRPILGAIDRAELDGVVVVVTRYFGGIKLGAGGLARAYGSSAAACLRAAARRRRVPRTRLRVGVDFAAAGALHALVERFAAERAGERYSAGGLELELTIADERRPEFEAALRDATSGAVRIEPIAAD